MSSDTTPRPRGHDKLTPYEAAYRVMDYIGEQQSGPWLVQNYTVSEQRGRFEKVKSEIGESPDRAVPAGDYIALSYMEDGYEPRDEQIEAGFTMMSNTPDEINDHNAAFENAHGRVLVNGLGLGCVVAGLLTKPEVEHIDVVEKDADVIAITGPAFADDDRVTVHHGDALTIPWQDGTRWNYVWHDIWAKISDKNLEDDEAEHGITYWKLFDRYRPLCDEQDAWIFRYALIMAKAHELATQRMLDMAEAWRDGSVEERIELVVDYHANGQRLKAPVEAVRAMLESDAKTWADLVKKAEDTSQAFFFIEAHTYYDEAKDLVTEEDARAHINGELQFEPFDTAAALDKIREMGDDADRKH